MHKCVSLFLWRKNRKYSVIMDTLFSLFERSLHELKGMDFSRLSKEKQGDKYQGELE